jgi:hypothetical protein
VRIFAYIAAFLFALVSPASAEFFTIGTNPSGVTINPDSLVLASPQNDASLGQLNCFANSTDLGNFYGTAAFFYQNAIGGQSSIPGSQAPTGFFSGSPLATAEMCLIRIGQTGSRARLISGTLCETGSSLGTGCQVSTTTCATPGVAPCSIYPLLSSITNGTLSWTQDGIAQCIGYSGCADTTPIDVSGSANLTAAATTIQNAFLTEATALASGTTGATITGATVAPYTCPGLNGTLGAAYFSVTSVTNNCLYVGGNVIGPPVGVNVLFVQTSGSTASTGTYQVSLPVTSTSLPLSPYTCVSCTLNYSVLTVGTVGSTDKISTGQGLHDNAGGAGVGQSGIFGQLTSCSGASSAYICTYTYPSTCTGSACNGTQWVLGASPNQLTVSSETAYATVCPLETIITPYSGVSLNTIRMWVEHWPFCTSAEPISTLGYFTSNSTASTDNLATVFGLSANSTGVVTHAPPAGLAVSTLYSGPWLSASNEAIGDPASPYASSYSTWLAHFYSSVPGAQTIHNFQFWWDPDDGAQTPTFKNTISAWFTANEPNYVYARIWADNSYSEASYSSNAPYGLPVCVPNVTYYTISTCSGPQCSGTTAWNPDYCPVHDYIAVGAAGSTAASTNTTGTGFPGGSGAGGGVTWVQGITTDSGVIPISSATSPASLVQVGAAGVGLAGNYTGPKGPWKLLSSGTLTAPSGANGSGVTGGTAATNTQCTSPAIVLNAGTWGSCVDFSGANGTTGTSSAGAGGAGGASSATLVGNGFTGTDGAGAGGGGGGGTSGNASTPVTGTGGTGGTNLDSLTAGAPGTATAFNAGYRYGGGGGGPTSGTTQNGGAGAIGSSGIEFITHPAHPCTAGGPGGGGGAGAGNRVASATSTGGAGGNGGLYGGSAGSGGAENGTTAVAGASGTSSDGFMCIIGYQDH